MIRRSLPCVALAAIAACADRSPTGSLVSLDASGAARAATFGVRDVVVLDMPAGVEGTGFDVNERGDVAAVAATAGPSNPAGFRPVFWSARTGALDLGTLGGPAGETRSLSNSGLVVGRSQRAGDAPSQSRPTAWRVGPHGVTVMEAGAFVTGELQSVNQSGTAVGWGTETAAGPRVAFRWTESGGVEFLPTLGGSRSTAYGINERGDIAGSSTLADGPGQFEHAVVWLAGGGMRDLGTLGGNTTAASVNQRGEVSGFGSACGSCNAQAFYGSEDGLVPLGFFGGTRSFSFHIDADGRVYGWADSGVGTPRTGFVWHRDQGVILTLPSLGGDFATVGRGSRNGELAGAASDGTGVVRAVKWRLGMGR